MKIQKYQNPSGPDAATHTNKTYYPVFSQRKLRIPTDHSFSYWDNILLPELEEAMQQNGINVNNHVYTYKKYSIGDLAPQNIGKDNLGNWKFTDADVKRNGGKLFNRQ